MIEVDLTMHFVVIALMATLGFALRYTGKKANKI